MSAPSNSLTMNKPVETSLLDQGVQAIIGRPLDRYEGPLKVSGTAPYAAEYPVQDLAFGVLVGAKVGAGRIVNIDADAVRGLPGVLDVVTDLKHFLHTPQQGGETSAPPQGVEEVAYFGQIVAIVLGDSYEAARDAALRLPVAYDEDGSDGRFDFDALKGDTIEPPFNNIPAHFSQGDLDQGLAEATHVVDMTFSTPSQNSAAMEPHASTAAWSPEGELLLFGSYQMPSSDAQQLADALGVSKSKVRIIARYIGGGFGSKLGICPESVAAAIAARQLGRPVKCVMMRQQVFDATHRRSNTEQRIRLGADRDGRLLAIGHETLVSNTGKDKYFEPAGQATHALYRGEHRRITHDLVPLNWNGAGSMRAPGEAIGTMTLEIAMDVLAERTGLDPIELRRRNEPERDPEKDVPFSTRQLIPSLEEGARRFGWDRRNPRPGQVRDGEWYVGMGVASAVRNNLLMTSSAKVSVDAAGQATVETAMTDIGTGSYTILAQIAGELLGLPLERITVKLGDTDLPEAAGSGGSWGAGSSGSSVYLACESIREQVAKRLGVAADAVTFKDGQVIAENRSTPLAELAAEGLEATGTIKQGAQEKLTTQASYGAHFCEVGVNAVTGEVRIRRFLGVFAAGRILNEKTARSQCLGGITFAIGTALTEELVHDTRNGRIVNHDLAEYHVPVNADVPQIEVHFLPERDIHANPLHAKGIGELGISGASAAIANAIHNACGVRVTDFPITCDKLLPGLPPL
jgi:xanthine dehydrogenase YagR molybdenum-binding subunit